MRYSVAALLFLLALSTSCLAAVNFSGIWTLDLKASDSPDPMMKRMGVPLIHRKLAASTKLEATYRLLRNSQILQPSSHHIGFDLHRMSATLGR
jgi:hypothetical protein